MRKKRSIVIPSWLDVAAEVRAALHEGRPVVALESSLVAQGLPWPHNLQTARRAEAVIHAEGAVPATVAVLHGKPTIGLDDAPLEDLARPGQPVVKLSRRDLAMAATLGATGGTTVAATMYLAHAAGIRVFATGGIGGVHRPLAGETGSWDVSADLYELSRIPVAVVCSGAKSILDIPRTLEVLESLSVPVVGFGVDEFPAFYLRSSGARAPVRVDSVERAALLLKRHWQMEGGGAIVAQPVPESVALVPAEFEAALETAEKLATERHIQGSKLTPFLLHQLVELTQEKTLRANIELVVANARLGAQIAGVLAEKD